MDEFENKGRPSVIEDQELEQVSGGSLPTATVPDAKIMILANSPDTEPPATAVKPRIL